MYKSFPSIHQTLSLLSFFCFLAAEEEALTLDWEAIVVDICSGDYTDWY